MISLTRLLTRADSKMQCNAVECFVNSKTQNGMGSYVQLRYEQREKIAQLWQSKASITQIALAMGRSKSTISRELKRNQSPLSQYWPDTAQRFTLKRRQRFCRIEQNEPLRDFIINKLCCHYWTPEQIAAWLKSRQKKLPAVCHESIYSWFFQSLKRKRNSGSFCLAIRGSEILENIIAQALAVFRIAFPFLKSPICPYGL